MTRELRQKFFNGLFIPYVRLDGPRGSTTMVLLERVGSMSVLSGRAMAITLLSILTGVLGCYSTRTLLPEALGTLDSPVICRLHRHDGEILRVSVDPRFVTTAEIRCYLCVHDGSSWEVQYSGWPAVFSSGKEWRRAIYSEQLVIPLEEIERVEVEGLSWFRTVATSPVTLPAGFIDFLFRYTRIGFDAVNDRIGTFTSTPE